MTFEPIKLTATVRNLGSWVEPGRMGAQPVRTGSIHPNNLLMLLILDYDSNICFCHEPLKTIENYGDQIVILKNIELE